MTPVRLLAATAVVATLACPAFAQTSPVPITVQVINDSGLPDEKVFLLLGGKSLTVGTTTYPLSVSGVTSVDMGATSPPTTTGTPLSCTSPCTTPITQATGADGSPLTALSTYTGQTRPVYQFSMTTVGSGVLYISYDTGVTYPTAPTVTANYRFQPFEFTYSQYVNSNGDLTSIDFFGIPLELSTYAPGDTKFKYPLDRVTYYTSTPTLLQSLQNLSSDLQNAMVAKSCATPGTCTRTTFVPGTTDYRDFLRVIGPNQTAAPGASPLPGGLPVGKAKPWPWPSFANYLDALATAAYTFDEVDAKNVSAYTFSFTGSVTTMSASTTSPCLAPSLATDGWLITLTSTGAAQAPLPNGATNAQICIPLPSNRADFFIYGAAQNCESLGISYTDASGEQQLFACSDTDKTALGDLTNSVYGWVQADVLSALNFGYMQGKADAANNGVGNSGVWYNLPPVQYPFGQARTTKDGYYNPWAALFYNNSDAYGFAFSDRNGRPSPDIAFPVDASQSPAVAGTVRIWILPDQRLDAPMVSAAPSDTSVTLTWPAVSGADHYVVTWSPPYATLSQTVPQSSAVNGVLTTSVPNLKQGTPYTMTVRAFNADASQASFELPVYALTTGTTPPPAQGNAVANFTFNWKRPAGISAYDVYIAGTKASYATGSHQVQGVPITTGPLAASAPLSVTGSGLAVMQAITPSVIAPNGTAAMTVTLGGPALPALSLASSFTATMPAGVTIAQNTASLTAQYANASVATGQSVVLTVTLGVGTTATTLVAPFTITLPAGMAPSHNNLGTCTNVAISGTTVTMAAGATIPAARCTIQVAAVGSSAGSFVATTSSLQTGVGVALPVSAGVTVTGPGTAVTQTIVPAAIAPGGTATMTITVGDTAQPTLTLTSPFSVSLPAGVSVASSSVSLSAALLPTAIASGGTSDLTLSLGNASTATISLASVFSVALPTGVTTQSQDNGTCGAQVTSNTITLPANSAIPVNGCTIKVKLTSTSVGSYTVTTSALATNAGAAPAVSVPVSVAGAGLAVQASVTPTSAAPGSPATLTVVFGDTSSGTGLALSQPFFITIPPGVTLSNASATYGSSQCVGVNLNANPIGVGPVQVTTQGACTITGTLTAATPAAYIVTTSTLTTATGTASAGSAPFTVAPPLTTCPNVSTAGSTIAMGAGKASTGTCIIAAALTASAPEAFVITTSTLATTQGTAVAASAPLVVAVPTCPSVAWTANGFNMGNVAVGSAMCSIAATLSAAQPGTYVVSTSGLATAGNGSAPAASAPLTVPGATSDVSLAFAPPVIAAGATAQLTISLANASANAVTLTDAFVNALPPGVTTASSSNAGTCTPVTVGAKHMSLPAGATIPVGGCTIVVTVTSNTPGSVTDTTGTPLTNATTYTTHAFPLELRVNQQPIWAANYYLTFVGSPQAFSVGPCGPTDTCAGSSATALAPIDTVRTPNFLERQGNALSITGGRTGTGPPFGANTPQIGVSFVPVANKKAADIVLPSQ